MLSIAETVIRPIQAADNPALALIIRNALSEFGANKTGTVYYDPTTDALFNLFQTPGSFYLVATHNREVLGGAGIFPSAGLPPRVCELVKMYLQQSARGKGIGKLLIEQCLEKAKAQGYNRVYLETMPELGKAIGLYERLGFRHLTGAMGNTGHFGCTVWMIKDLA